MEDLFSKRLKKALEKRTIPYPSFSRNLRKRLAMKCRDHNEFESFGDYAETKAEALSSLERTTGQKYFGFRIQPGMLPKRLLTKVG
jgi:hypothetical protein